MAELSASCVHANFLHFYFWIFSLRIFCLYKCPLKLSKKCLLYYCLVITLWKCEYCLIWALNKSILFAGNSLKVSVLCDMNSEKTFYWSLVWKELSENVSIVRYKFWKSVILFASNSLETPVLFDLMENCVLLFASNSRKMPLLLDVCKIV